MEGRFSGAEPPLDASIGRAVFEPVERAAPLHNPEQYDQRRCQKRKAAPQSFASLRAVQDAYFSAATKRASRVLPLWGLFSTMGARSPTRSSNGGCVLSTWPNAPCPL